LPIHAHPNKRLAEELHSEFPAHYPDDNHKPVVCIPIGNFEVLAGFRPIEQIRKQIREVEELQFLCGREGDIDCSSIRELHARLLHADLSDVRLQARALTLRLSDKDAESRTDDEKLILRLVKDYPADVGIFSVFFLNYIRITPDMDQSYVYFAPDEPHAYLSGDCVECAAVSDNIVRAGLSGKHKDVPTLLNMLTYRDDMLSELLRCGEKVHPNITKYDPPVDEFCLYKVHGPVLEGLQLPRASIAVCLQGAMVAEIQASDGREGESSEQVRLVFGQTVFCRAGSRLVVHSAEEGSQIFIATT